ncbi:MAG: hypothetical protein LBH25_05290 [Fibromonadaceae bacterium]|jgi:hypothetical protein|nr:hypothetical protein [Fibromonadaceae bacterium]
MLNIVKNILAWADKEPMPFDDWHAFDKENEHSLMLQIKQKGFELRNFMDIVNPPPEIAPRLGELTDILISATDSLEYHPRTIEMVIRSLGNKAIVKKQNLFSFLYERYLVVPPSDKIHNPQARGVDSGLTSSLAHHFTWDNFDKIKDLIKDESLGESRMLLLTAFTRFLHKEEVRQLLLGLMDHPVFASESKRLLKRKVRKSK